MSDSSLKTYLAENPKMAGVLFTVLLLLNQAGTVVAGNGAGTVGP